MKVILSEDSSLYGHMPEVKDLRRPDANIVNLKSLTEIPSAPAD
jgi:hypothetical protein